MAHQLRFLSTDLLPQLTECFNEAFADYYMKFTKIPQEVVLNRSLKNGVDFESSVGVFDNDRLVGFTMIGIDQWNGVKAAFDAGTGIIPDYRGKGIAKEMFDFSLSRLKEQEVAKFLLEVLQVNKPAIKAYRKAGFKITRELDCFELELNKWKTPKPDDSITFEIRDKNILDSFEATLDWKPSWENSFNSIRRIPDEVRLITADCDNQPVGLITYYPLLNWILTLLVKKEYRNRGIGALLVDRLIRTLPEDHQKIRVVNVEHTDNAMIRFFLKNKFKLFISQYEMQSLI